MRLKLYLVIAVVIGFSSQSLQAQLTDDNGLITSNNWLVLGPFANPYGCGRAEDQLGNHIAPSFIGCEYPEEFDEVDYDVGLAVSTAYVGVDPEPIWRRFDDGSDDGDINLDADVTGDLSDVMSWLITYVEYAGDSPAFVELCVGSDDNVQVWIDNQLVHNNNSCRGRGVCQDFVPVMITPGAHRIAMAVWERGGGWGGSLGLQQSGHGPSTLRGLAG